MSCDPLAADELHGILTLYLEEGMDAYPVS